MLHGLSASKIRKKNLRKIVEKKNKRSGSSGGVSTCDSVLNGSEVKYTLEESKFANRACDDKIHLKSESGKTSSENKLDFIAECYYKEKTYSPEDFQKRLAEFKLKSGDKSDNLKDSIEIYSISDKCDGIESCGDLIIPLDDNTFVPGGNIEEEGGGINSQVTLMLSAAERQELAENAMEQLASGLNRAAEAMQGEPGQGEEEEPEVLLKAGRDPANLGDKELFQLLEEAVSYKSKKDRDGKSEMFRELLEKAEENSSGEEQWDVNFRKHVTHQDSISSKKKKKKVSESNKKGGSLSNLSCLSDFESGTSSGRSGGKNKKSRSSVSSRSREGGSLPPTKFENVMLYESVCPSLPPNTGPPSASFAWDTGGKGMPVECMAGLSEAESVTSLNRDPQLLIHSSSDSVLRKQLVESCSIDMVEQVGTETCDTDSNKTEVEEIEMVDMEGRDSGQMEEDDETIPLLQARQIMETRGRVVGNHGPAEDGIEMGSNWSSVRSVTETGEDTTTKQSLDENGNPTSSSYPNNGPFPIMDPQLRPLSIYRHTPVFRPQKLTVPSMAIENNGGSASSNPGGTGGEREGGREVASNKGNGDREGKRKARRKKDEEKNVMKAEDIEGYRGNKDIDSILDFLGEKENKNKKKSAEKVVDKNKKNTSKSEVQKEDPKVKNKKKEKSVEKENIVKQLVIKKSSVENSCETVDELEDTLEDNEDISIVHQFSSHNTKELIVELKQEGNSVKEQPVEEQAIVPPSLSHCGRANSAPSNDSGHVSAEPCSLPSVSSTKEMSIASSPPLDLDPVENLLLLEQLKEGQVSQSKEEFTKVTKKQRKKKGTVPARERSDKTYHSGSAFSEENRSRGDDVSRRSQTSHPGRGGSGVGQSASGSVSGDTEEQWSFRGYNRMRGSREAVTGTKSTCSVPPSDASDTDDHDSVHSLPVGSTRKKVSTPAHSVSSGHTPQASYADIARHAAALYTQQAGQQQHAVYREQLQFRDLTPGSNTKESVSSSDGDCMMSYSQGGDLSLDNTVTFPPVQQTNTTHQLARAVSEPSDYCSHHTGETVTFIQPNTTTSTSHSNIPKQNTETVQVKTKHSDSNSTTNLGAEVAQSGPSLVENKSFSRAPLPPVVILDSTKDYSETNIESDFTFGFEVNEDLLAMSYLDTNMKGSEHISNEPEETQANYNDCCFSNAEVAHINHVKCEDIKSSVNNQKLVDNEIVKNLPEKSHDNQSKILSDKSLVVDFLNINPPIIDVEGNEFIEDNEDVVVENQTFNDTKAVTEVRPKTLGFEDFPADCRKFNYDVIVSFVKQAWEVVNKELKNGNQVVYYSQ